MRNNNLEVVRFRKPFDCAFKVRSQPFVKKSEATFVVLLPRTLFLFSTILFRKNAKGFVALSYVMKFIANVIYVRKVLILELSATC